MVLRVSLWARNLRGRRLRQACKSTRSCSTIHASRCNARRVQPPAQVSKSTARCTPTWRASRPSSPRTLARASSIFLSMSGGVICWQSIGFARHPSCAIWPDRIQITVEERVPVAFASLPIGGSARHWLALIDEQGVLLTLPPRTRFPLPVLSGITEDQTEAAAADARGSHAASAGGSGPAGQRDLGNQRGHVRGHARRDHRGRPRG